MSAWTSVVGCIRVDGVCLPEEGPAPLERVRTILGPICTFESLLENEDPYKNLKLPCGSEGSLQYQIIEYGTGMPWLCIPIWGDLRDFQDAKAIQAWWENLLKELGYIRDAVLTINTGDYPITLTYLDPLNPDHKKKAVCDGPN
jgi:hypothetical protein